MRSRISALVGLGLVLAAFATVAAQQSQPVATTSAASARWTAPRTPDGRPDLQGVWVNNTVTPFERPPALAGKQFLTSAELAVLKQRVARLFSGHGDIAPGDELFLALLSNPEEHTTTLRATGDYNQFWLDDGLEFENRTSQVVEPSDGLLPLLTFEGQEKQTAAFEWNRLHSADGPEDRSPQERCLSFGTARLGSSRRPGMW